MYTELHPDAEIELTEHALYYESMEPGLGYRFINEIEYGIKLLMLQPRIGREIDNEFRCFVFNDFPFLLIYRIEPEKIWILAVAHQSRRPGYWRERMG